MKLSHESWRSGLQFKRMNNYKRILVASCWKFYFEMISDLAVCAWGCSAGIMWCWCGELQFCKKLRELRSIDSGDRWLLTESIGKIQSLGVFSELLAGCGSRPAVNSYCLGSTEWSPLTHELTQLRVNVGSDQRVRIVQQGSTLVPH